MKSNIAGRDSTTDDAIPPDPWAILSRITLAEPIGNPLRGPATPFDVYLLHTFGPIIRAAQLIAEANR